MKAYSTQSEYQELEAYNKVHGYLPDHKTLLCGRPTHTNLVRTLIRTFDDNRARRATMDVTCPQCKETWEYVEARIEWEHM